MWAKRRVGWVSGAGGCGGDPKDAGRRPCRRLDNNVSERNIRRAPTSRSLVRVYT